jgi:hypothetical protein
LHGESRSAFKPRIHSGEMIIHSCNGHAPINCLSAVSPHSHRNIIL